MTTLPNLKFLIVDDFSAMRRIVRNFLKELGCSSTMEAEDGVVALTLLREHQFDFVIVDINMPNMNGFELLRTIKADEDLKHLPVLMVSAEANKDDIIFAARSGAAGFLIKPFTKTGLEEKITEAMQRLSASQN